MAAHYLVRGHSWNCSYHVGWVDVLEGHLNSLLFAVLDDLLLEECSDIRQFDVSRLVNARPMNSAVSSSLPSSLSNDNHHML